MIHGGLNIDFKSTKPNDLPRVGHCCLRETFPVAADSNFWTDVKLEKLRDTNKQNIWDPGCSNCQTLESVKELSFRNGMNQGLEIFGQTDLSGPVRIDLMFDISCNLACRSCNPRVSSYWQRHLKEHNLWHGPITITRNRSKVIEVLSKLDLSNLRQLVFCGGETLLGQEYWHVVDWLAKHVPNADQQLTLCFQTNGTQNINPKNFSLIEKFHLVKLHVSLDGIDRRFEYLRWPAQWNQVTDNILNLRETLPSNVMFVVEETVSIFNLPYQKELKTWVDNNFTKNREGDEINHTKHMAVGVFTLENMSTEYVEYINKTDYKNYIPSSWKENPVAIQNMLAEIKKFDALRNESFANVFPELVNLYSKFW
jgi:hypothetical protein